jgi:hypothetical protein
LDTPQNPEDRVWTATNAAIEADSAFAEFKKQHPIQARLLLGFFKHADAAVEALRNHGDIEAAKRSVAAMSELYSWLKNADPPIIDRSTAETYWELIQAGLPTEQSHKYLLAHSKRARKRPVSNRLPIVLACEEKELNPKLSWSQLAIKYCNCGKSQHDFQCRERIRVPAYDLKDMLNRLGV